MKSFKIFFEESEIESLEALIANPDPSRVKMYGGGTEYVDMLKRKLEKAKQGSSEMKVKDLTNDEFFSRFTDYGISYRGYHLEVEQDEEPNERYFYYGTIYNPQGQSIQLPEKEVGAGSEDFINTMGGIKVNEFKSFIDKNLAAEEDAADRCKRKADQVYGKKTSAYKSGAIVRCRKGKIWKKK